MPREVGRGLLDRVRGVGRFAREVLEQSGHDRVLFLASGLTFSLLLAAIPFLLLILSVVGLLLAPRLQVAPADVLDRLWEYVPISDPTVQAEVGRQLAEVIGNAGSLGLISGTLFVWFSARLFAALRAALGEVFDVRDRPGFLHALLRDLFMVVSSTVLLTANVVLTSALAGVGAGELERLGIDPGAVVSALGFVSAYLFVFLMYLLIYKVVPGDRLRWRTAAVAAVFAATAFEALKAAFGWYLATFGDVGPFSFALATLIVLVVSLYYSSVIFLLGGEVAKVAALRRIMRARLEMFEPT